MLIVSRLLVVQALAIAVSLATGAAWAEDGDDQSLRDAIGDSAKATKGEILKAASARKAFMEGLATYRAQQKLQNKAAQLRIDMSQPEQICQQIDSQSMLSNGAQQQRARVAAAQRKSVAGVTRNTNSIGTLDANFDSSNTRFCSETEQKAGVCKATTDTRYTNLAGADQNAMYLFQSRSGGETYEGTKDSGQVDAVNAYISRVVAGGVSPEQLRMTGTAAYEKNPQARAYMELQRRYTAFLSMAAYSLNQIKESRTAK